MIRTEAEIDALRFQIVPGQELGAIGALDQIETGQAGVPGHPQLRGGLQLPNVHGQIGRQPGALQSQRHHVIEERLGLQQIEAFQLEAGLGGRPGRRSGTGESDESALPDFRAQLEAGWRIAGKGEIADRYGEVVQIIGQRLARRAVADAETEPIHRGFAQIELPRFARDSRSRRGFAARFWGLGAE